MLEKIELNCLNCGAPLNRRTMVCEYCGTRYKRDGEEVPMLREYFQPRVETLYCTARLDRLYLKEPELAKMRAMDCIAKGLAKEILKHIELTTVHDPHSFDDIIKGRIKIVVGE